MKDLRTTINRNEEQHLNANTISGGEAKRVEIHNTYLWFVDSYDNIVLGDLSDSDLRSFHAFCVDGMIEANEEIRRRKL